MEHQIQNVVIPQQKFRRINLDQRLQSISLKTSTNQGKLTDEEIIQLFSGYNKSSSLPNFDLSPNLRTYKKNHSNRSGIPRQMKKRRKKYLNTKISNMARKKILEVLQERKKLKEKKTQEMKAEALIKILSTEELTKVIDRSKASLLDGRRLFSNLEILVWKIDSILNQSQNGAGRMIHKPNYFQIQDQSRFPASLLRHRFQRPETKY